MKNRNRFGWLPVILLLVMAVGCTTPRTLGYLLDMEYNKEYPAAPAPELKMQKEDRLRIQVLSEKAELSAPFNTLLTLTDLANQTTQQPILTYVIDREGNIDFPILGTLHVEGMTLKEIEQMISGILISKGYIKEPVVNAELDNFQVTFIGGGGAGGGVMQVQGHSFNLLQAIARIRGTNSEQINIKEVTVIRTENGVRTAYSVNMQKKALFDSPVFYLQQNDVIYYKPKVYRISQPANAFLGFIGTITGVVSLVLTYLALSR